MKYVFMSDLLTIIALTAGLPELTAEADSLVIWNLRSRPHL